jgi:hypothetical protein
MPFTDKQKQWLWFVCLWCAGLAGAFVLAQAAKWLFHF